MKISTHVYRNTNLLKWISFVVSLQCENLWENCCSGQLRILIVDIENWFETFTEKIITVEGKHKLHDHYVSQKVIYMIVKLIQCRCLIIQGPCHWQYSYAIAICFWFKEN